MGKSTGRWSDWHLSLRSTRHIPKKFELQSILGNNFSSWTTIVGSSQSSSAKWKNGWHFLTFFFPKEKRSFSQFLICRCIGRVIEQSSNRCEKTTRATLYLRMKEVFPTSLSPNRMILKTDDGVTGSLRDKNKVILNNIMRIRTYICIGKRRRSYWTRMQRNYQ